ncbi:MAG: hypothetical protein GY757_04365, partial [bacterium]|nr:hypothetical protein [bacterium]
MRNLFVLLSLALVTLTLTSPITQFAGSSDGKAEEPGYTMPRDVTDYETLWREVLKFTAEGLHRSALKPVEKIVTIAKRKNNAGQFIKAVIKKTQLIGELEEDPHIKVINELSIQLKKSRFPITPVLHSMLAQKIWHYYRDNRRRILRRTATKGVKQEDMRTWDMRTLTAAVVTHYQKSLENPARAKATRIDAYNAILIKSRTGHTYRPTLYDFLAHRAIDFYMETESGLTQPAVPFSLNKAAYFKDAEEFVKLDITAREPREHPSFPYLALTGLQELTRFHLKDKNREALVDVQLKRIRYLYKEAMLGGKEQIYERVLHDMIDKYGDSQVTAEIYYELAKHYRKLGNKYQPGKARKFYQSASYDENDDYKWKKKQAHELCRKGIKKSPDTIGAHNCQYLIAQIEAKSVNITVEDIGLPGKPFQALVKYKNIDKIVLKIVKTDWKELNETEKLQRREKIAHYLSKEAYRIREIQLPQEGDFQPHTTEIKIEALEPGKYVLLVSDNKTFDYKKHIVSWNPFTLSNIAYIYRNVSSEGKGIHFHILHRDTGQPLNKARARVWYREYNPDTKKNERKKGEELQTDKSGFFEILKKPFDSNTKHDSGFSLEITHNNDRLETYSNFYLYKPDKPPEIELQTYFFTDRAIYRPGQTVYFKGILIYNHETEGAKTRLATNHQTRVIFNDANEQEISALQLKSSDYGTISGSFQIPTDRLNGFMTISGENGQSYFSVEEYKRPKFEVRFFPIKEAYKLGENVTVKGKAAAYAGYTIANAEVTYRVTRSVFYPGQWDDWAHTPHDRRMEIANGKTKTDAGGGFEVKYKAIPDRGIATARQPAFTYRVQVDITDINGETRSGHGDHSIGNTALKILLKIPLEVNRDDPQHRYPIRTTTLSGGHLPAAGEIAIYKLKNNPGVSRKKLWDNPDQYIIEKEQYYKLFPYDSYGDEGDYRKLEKEKLYYYGTFDTGKEKKLNLSTLPTWPTGKYVVEMKANDRYGTPIKDKRNFILYSAKEKQVPFKQPAWFMMPKDTVPPGGKVVLLVGTSWTGVRGIYEVQYQGKIIKKQTITLNNEQKQIEIPIKKEYRGNLRVHFTYIKHNRLYRYEELVTVPWTDKELDITFETFRNKIKPGQKEEWRIKIRGQKGPKGEPG